MIKLIFKVSSANQDPKIESSIQSKIKRQDIFLFNIFTTARISKVSQRNAISNSLPSNRIKRDIQNY